VLVATAAVAQAQSGRLAEGEGGEGGGALARADERAEPTGRERPAALEETSSAVPQRPQPPFVGPLPREAPKRRGSMVGYIADATVDNQIRVRFDAGFHSNRPDRSEFFYAQCGCNGPGGPGPIGTADDLNFQQLSIDAQYVVRSRVALLATIPMRFIRPQHFFNSAATFGNQSGLSDVRVGVKAAVVSADDMVLSAQVVGYFPTGDPRKGLGTDHASVETALLLHKQLSDRLALESQLSDWHPIGGSSANGVSYTGDVLSYGIGPSFDLVNTNRVRFAPVIELVGWHLFNGQQLQPPGRLAASDANIVNLKFGARTIIDGRSSFYVGWGRALTNAVWYTDIIRLEYRYSF
jgi:hypothetical protein